mmetsp:Transcript_15523/g.33670  ORF Transcript_15523/g.33670 Transcript_15523/m.33670 type:complete len:279 (-) Transcript_15523:132-968(-)
MVCGHVLHGQVLRTMQLVADSTLELHRVPNSDWHTVCLAHSLKYLLLFVVLLLLHGFCLKRLVTLLAYAKVALPAIVEALSFCNALAALVTSIFGICLPLLHCMPLWTFHCHRTRRCRHGAASKSRKKGLVHPLLLLTGGSRRCSSGGGGVGFGTWFPTSSASASPLEGCRACHAQELIHHDLLFHVHVGEAHPSEEGSEQIRSMVEAIHFVQFVLIDTSRRIVSVPFQLVSQHLVGCRYFLKLRCGLWIIWILVGMPTQCKPSVGFLDFVWRCGDRH